MSASRKTTSNNTTTWTYSLFDCCSPGQLCFMTCCLPCITYGKTQHNTKLGSLEGYSCCNSFCIVYCLASHVGLQCIPAAMQRTLLREKYKLEGSWFGDFLKSGCCTCCVLMQNAKELEQHGSASNLSEPYRPNGAMMYPRAN